MTDADFHSSTQYQSWGRDTLRQVGLPKKFNGKLTVELSFHDGELMEGLTVEIRQRIGSNRFKTNTDK